ncbi:hypothetical protein L1276_003396 [Flavobacterium sp. HSC-32F16]|nr:hypothetical protein [Flavobacterium sp. HSC-32F16]
MKTKIILLLKLFFFRNISIQVVWKKRMWPVSIDNFNVWVAFFQFYNTTQTYSCRLKASFIEVRLASLAKNGITTFQKERLF